MELYVSELCFAYKRHLVKSYGKNDLLTKTRLVISIKKCHHHDYFYLLFLTRKAT